MREPAARRRLDDVVAAFVADARARNLSPATISSYLEALDAFRGSLEPRPARQTLAELSLEAARAWVAEYAGGRKPATVANRVRSLRVFGRWCVDEGYLRSDPLARLRRPLVPRVVIEPFSDTQVLALLGAAPVPLAITLRILFDTGVRISEATGLRVADVRDGYLRVRGKGGHERLVPVGRLLAAALRRYLERERPRAERPDEPLLLGRDGRPLTARAVYQAMRRLARAVGVAGVRVSPHTCRHTFAIGFLRNGGSVLALQRILGHRDLAMVRRYAELTDADVVAAHGAASPLDRLAERGSAAHGQAASRPATRRRRSPTMWSSGLPF